MTIYAIVPAHNRIGLTLQFLDSLDAQVTSEDVKVIVVDDGSTDGTAYSLSKRAGRFPITVLSGSGKLWWAGAVRQGLAFIQPNLAAGDWVYLANNDTVLESSHLTYLVETAVEYAPALVGAASIEIWPDGTHHRTSSGFRIDASALSVEMIAPSDALQTDVDALAGRGLLMSTDAARSFRLYPRLMPQHFADISATQRLKRQGYKLVVDPRAICTQTDRASSAVEAGAILRPSWNRKDTLYIPALIAFWWNAMPTVTFLRSIRKMWQRR